MHPNWHPQLRVRRIYDITVSQLREWGIEGLILDIDNTLATHNNPIPGEGVSQWLSAMRREGIKLIILSNNSAARVTPFAGDLGLSFISNGKKPLKGGYFRCAKALSLPCEKLCMIGDQLFTDIWGGRRAGCKTILVQPIEEEKTLFFRLKRKLEEAILRNR